MTELVIRAWKAVLLSTTLASSSIASGETRIYLAPDDHTDYMWTGNEEAYRQSFVRMLDYYLDLADKTAKESEAWQSRWHADGSFWLWVYQHDKTPAEFQRLISRVRDGHISFPLNALVSTYGGTPTEAVLRGMYYAGSLQRRFGLQIPLAIANENQTLPYGLGALWAGAGAQYSWKGICGCASKIDFYGKRPHDVYWWKGDDGSRILMKWYALSQGRHWLGNYLEARQTSDVVHFVETDPAFKAANPYSVIGIFGKGGDDLETLTDQFVKVAREQTTPARKVIVSNIVDYFRDLEKTEGSSLPEFSAAFGNEWDLYTASVSELSARVRRAVERLRGAEALASLVSLKRSSFMNGRDEQRSLAFINLGVFWEHDWTGDGPVSRPDRANWGRRVAGQIENYVDNLETESAFSLGGMIRSSGKNKRFYVFNPLSWTRTAIADIPYSGSDPVHVVDLSTGDEVPWQTVTAPEFDAHPNGRYLRILAPSLPSVGYKVFELRSGPGKRFEPAAAVSGSSFENSRYRVTVAGNGAISSFIDKQQNHREFAGKTLNDLGPEIGEVTVENAGPVSVTLRAASDGPLSHISRITLYRDSDRVDIRNDITQNFDGTHTWNFGFKLTAPDVWHEESGVVLHAKLTTEGGHYSPSMSRLDWLTLNHFADISGEGGAGVTLSSADLSFMKLGGSSVVRGISTLDTSTPALHVLAGGQVDGPYLGIHKQAGDTHFLQRFSLRTHSASFNPTEAMQFALEHQNPPVSGWLREGGRDYPEQSYSLLAISNPDVLLWALKPAEDGIGRGLTVRTWNLSAQPQRYSVHLQPGIREAARMTHIETDTAPLPIESDTVPLSAARSQIQTVRLVPATDGTK